MKIEYANKLIETYHQRYGAEQPNANMQNADCFRMMYAWNRDNGGAISWNEYNRYFHIGDCWRKPSDRNKPDAGWHAYDFELLATGKSWFEVYVGHISREWWVDGIGTLMSITKLDRTACSCILMAILKYQVSPNITPKSTAYTEHLERLLLQRGYDVMLREATEDEDVQGIDYCTDTDFSDDLVFVQVKSNFDRWVYSASIEGTPQNRQRQQYDELAARAPLFIYDEAEDRIMRYGQGVEG